MPKKQQTPAQKAARKARKRERDKGDGYLPAREYAEQAAKARVAQGMAPLKRLEAAKNLIVPPSVSLREYHFQKNFPEYHAWLTSGKAVEVDKSYPEIVNRAIWYNELDKKHNFNTYSMNTKANVGFVRQHMADGMEDQVSELQKLFFAACMEYRGENKHCFQAREAFIKSWQQSEKDIMIFTQGTSHVARSTVER